ncbi:MAG: hypothetical protein ACNYPE_16715 [Candidatus Azotimanducaceae bacterium WSBS_2022_MAG_OTU7]
MAICHRVRYVVMLTFHLQKGRSRVRHTDRNQKCKLFRFLEAAIKHEIGRQTEVLESGGRIIQETRLYDPDKDETRPMRSKETATDYRYFPEPDLLPVIIDEAFIAKVREMMPEPRAKKSSIPHRHGINRARLTNVVFGSWARNLL